MKIKTKEQEQVCIDNIQSYLNRIYYLEIGGNIASIFPNKTCELCREFFEEREDDADENKDKSCANCPLGPILNGCGYGEINYTEGAKTFLNNFINVTPDRLKVRMSWLLKKYISAGLDPIIINEDEI